MTARKATFRKRFIRKLGINTKSDKKYLEVLFEEWPIIENEDDCVLLIKVLEDDPEEIEDECRCLLGRAEVLELVEFLQGLLQDPSSHP